MDAELGRPGAMHSLTADSLRAALFSSREYELRPSADWGDVNGRWSEPENFKSEPEIGAGFE
ncbi:MAG: hypothetical protein ACREN8_03065 [Candidatus Dormibacteraceae bacterium]